VIEVLVAIVYLVGVAATGMLVVLAVAPRTVRLPRLAVVTAGFPVGAFVLTYAIFLLLLFGMRMSGALVVAVLGAGLVVSLLVVRIRRPRFAPVAIRRPTAAEAALALLVLAALAYHGKRAITVPYGGDGLMFWQLKAVILQREGTVYSPSFTHPDVIHHHKRYPLLQPLLVAGLRSLRPGMSPEAERSVFAALLLSLYLCIYFALSRVSRPSVALSLLLLVALTPPGWVAAGYAAATVRLYLMGAVAFGLLWMQRETRGPPLRAPKVLVLLMAGMIFAKVEGTLYAGFLVLALLGLPRRRPAPRWRSVFACALAVAVLMLPWFVFRSTLPSTYEENYPSALAGADVARTAVKLPYVALMILQEAFLLEKWGPLWLVVIGAAVATRLRDRLWLIPGLALVAYVVLACVHDHDIVDYVMTTGERFLGAIVLPCLPIAAGAIEEAGARWFAASAKSARRVDAAAGPAG